MAQATDFDELTKVLETLVRKVMREELANFARENGLFYLSPGSPLYEDMEKILERKVKEQPKLYQRDEVWGE
ncbi:MAG: kinase/pyrophosphorylase [Chloroflexi bacterium]|nr:kinase/pyrophosphorylase [Chloroflexota bacterium]